jgi:hypothetical protein
MKNSKNNIEFKYMYRDAGNYKLFEEVVFLNPDNLHLELVDETIRRNLIDNEFFSPLKWGLKKPSFSKPVLELDHDWCEYLLINYSSKGSTSKSTILQFLNKISGQKTL